MQFNINIVTIDGQQHVEATLHSKTAELVYFVRAEYPDIVDHRKVAIATVLRELSDAVASGRINLEGVI